VEDSSGSAKLYGVILRFASCPKVEALCRSADDLGDAAPWDALVGWLQRFIGYVATKHALADELLAEADRDAEVFKSCRGAFYERSSRECHQSVLQGGADAPLARQRGGRPRWRDTPAESSRLPARRRNCGRERSRRPRTATRARAPNPAKTLFERVAADTSSDGACGV
jgi:hypothetical protein